jgi:hypothetical protein
MPTKDKRMREPNTSKTELKSHEPLAKRRIYTSPRIRSSEAFERLALACTGTLVAPNDRDCGAAKSGNVNLCASCAGS